MRKAVHLLGAFGAAFFLSSAARAQSPAGSTNGLAMSDAHRFEAVAALWRPNANIVVASDGLGMAGTPIDFNRDIGLDAGHFPAVQFVVRPAVRHSIRVEYIPIRYEGTAAFRQDVTFNGVRFPLGVPTTTTLDWKAYRVGYTYDFLVRNRIAAGLVFDVKQTDLQVRVKSAAADEARRTRVPVPAIGGVLRAYPMPRLSLAAEVIGFKVPDSADKHFGGSYVDVDASATIRLTDLFRARAGLRAFNIRHLGEADSGTLRLHGIYVAAVVVKD
jgi:hypothetical protein